MNTPGERLKIAGTNILTLRVSQKMSQNDLANKADVSRSTIVAAEAGKTTSTENLIKIADALGVDISDLFISRDKKIEITHRAIIFFEEFFRRMEKKK